MSTHATHADEPRKLSLSEWAALPSDEPGELVEPVPEGVVIIIPSMVGTRHGGEEPAVDEEAAT